VAPPTHLLYALYPRAHWRVNINLIRKYLHQFTGCRVIGISVNTRSDTIEKAIDYVKDDFDEVLTLEDNPELREAAMYYSLLDWAETRGWGGYAFMANSKGTSRDGDTKDRLAATRLWVKLLHETNLSDMDRVNTMLERYPILGSLKRYGKYPCFPDNQGDWHYSGTCYWLNLNNLFKKDWRGVYQHHRYGAEAFPGMMYDSDDGGVLWGDGVGNPYDLVYVEKLYKEWKKKD